MARDDRGPMKEGIASDDVRAGAPARAGAREPLDTGDRDERIDTRQLPGEGVSARSGSDAGVAPDRADLPGASSASSADTAAMGARPKDVGGRARSAEGPSATSGRSGSHRAAKEAGQHQMNATIRGAGSSGEQRGATTGPRKATRTAASETRGTAKPGIRRGSSKSRSGRRAQMH